MLPAAGAVGAVIGLAHGADAAITGAITAPTGVTAGGTLTWTFPTDYTDAAPTTTRCVITKPATPTAPASSSTLDCSTGQVSTPADAGSGSYRLDVYDGADTTVPATDSSTVVVAPDAPTATASTGTATPTWTLSDADPNATGYDPCTLASAPAGATTTPTCTISGSTLTLSTTGATPGAYTWTVSAHNGDGVSGPTTPVSYTVAAPTAPTTTNPDQSGFDRSPSWTLTDSDPGFTGYTCTLTAAPTGATATPDCTTTAGTLALALAGQPLGTYAVQVVARVNGVDSDPLTVHYTLTAPPAPTATTTATVRGTASTNTWTVTDADSNATYDCHVSGPTGSGATATCTAAGQVTLTVTGQPRGTYTVDVTAVDGTGTSPALTLTYRYAPPAPTVAATSANPQTVTGSQRTVTWTVTDADAAATFGCSITSPASTTATVSCDPTSGLVTLRLPAAAGTYVVTATAVDGGLTSAGLPLTYTLVAPATPTLTGGAANQKGTARTATWTVSTDDPTAQLSCTATDPASSTLAAGACAVAADGTVTLTIPAASPAGSYTVDVTATDAGSSAPLVLGYDLYPPAPTLAAGSAPANQTGLADDVAGTGRSPSWTVTDADPNAGYACTVTRPDGSALTGPAVTCTGGTVSLNLAGQPAGTYTVVVSAVDNGIASAGLDPADVLTLTYALAVPTPTLAVGSGPAAQSGTSRSPSWTVTDSDAAASFACSATRPDGSALTAITCAGGTVSLNLTGQPAGTYAVTVTATDAGVSSQGALTLTYLLYPPAPTLATGSNPANQTGVADDVAGTGRSPSWTVTDSDAAATFACSVTRPDGSPLAPAAVTCVGGTVSLNLAGQPAGTYTVTVTAMDNGISSTAIDPSAVLTLTYGLTVPDPTLAAGSNPANQTGIANDVAGTGRSPSWTVTDADAGAAFVCSVRRPDGTLLAGAVTCAGGTVTLNLAGQPAGVYTVTVTARDAGVSSPGALTLTYSLTVPNPTLAAGSNPANQTGVANDVAGTGRSPSWTVTDADAAATYLCAVTRPDGSALAPAAVTCVGGTVALNLSGQPAGIYTVTVRARDGGVNSPGTLTLTYSLTVPDPTLAAGSNPANQTGVANDAAGTGRSPSWTVADVDAGAAIACSVTRPNGSALPPTAVTCVGSTVSLNLSGQPAGIYTVRVSALDAGVNSPGALVLTYTLTVPAPTLAAGSNPADQTGVANDVAGTGRSPSWTVTDADAAAGFTCVVTRPDGSALAPAAVTCVGGTVGLSLAGQPAGTYTVTVRAVDAGVTSAGALTLTYLLVPPAPTLAAGSNPADQTGAADDVAGTGRSPSWTVTDADAGVGTYTCAVTRPDGSALAPTAVTCTGGTVSLNLAGQPAGTYTVTVAALDNGVASTTVDPSAVLTLTYVLTVPNPALATGSNPANQTGVANDVAGTGRSPSWTVTDADAGASYLCLVGRPDGTGLPGTAVTCTGGTVSLNLAGQPAGKYTVTVTAVDNGMTSPGSITLTYTLTVPNPTLATGSNPANQTGVANDVAGTGRSPSWTVTDADAGATFVCSVRRPDGSLLAPSAVTCTSTVSLNLVGQPAGTYTVTVRAVDAGVNSPGTLTLTYSLTVPNPTMATGSNPANQTGFANDVAGTGRSPSWTVTDADAGATFLCAVTRPDGSALSPSAVTCVGGAVALNLSGQPAGIYTVTVRAVDAGVNSPGTLLLTYTLTVPNPTLATGSNPADQTGVADDTAGTGRSPSWTVTDADAGATIGCSVTRPNGSPLPAPAVTCTGTTLALNLSGQPAGLYTVTVTATDAGVSSPGTLTLTYTLYPAVPTLAPASNPANQTGVADDVAGTGRSPSWTVTDADAGASFTCAVRRPDGTPLSSTAVTCTGGVVSLDLAGQPAGTYTVAVTGVDAGVNSLGTLSLSYTLTVPNPTLAAGSNPANQTGVADDVAGTGRSPSWTVTDADADATFLCAVTRPDGSALSPSAVTCVGGAVTLNLGGQPAGIYTVMVRAVDAGVNSPGTLSLTYSLTVPNPTLAAGSNPANQTGIADDVAGTGRSPSWTVSDADAGATFLCSVRRPDGSLLSPSAVTCVGGAVALNLSGQPAGLYTVTVRAVDAGVNSPGTLLLTYSLTVPNPTLAAGSNPASQTGVADDVAGTGRSPSWTVSDADAGATYLCSVRRPDGSLLAPSAVTCAGGTVSLNLAGQPAGTYTVTVTATDAGVTSPGTLTLTYVLYPPAPTLAAGSNPANQTGVADDVAGTGRSPSWTVTDADAAATYVCSVTRPDGTVSTGTAVTCSGGMVALNLAGQPAGTYVVTVAATDNGVLSTDLNPAAVLTVTYALTVPNPTLAAGSNPADQSGVADDVAGTGRSPSWTVTDLDADATYVCSVTRPNGSALTGTAVTCSGGTVALNLAGEPAGTYTVTVTAVDAGVSSPGTLRLTYALGVSAPTLAAGSNPANQTGVADDVAGTGRSPSWSVTDTDAAATFTCSVRRPDGSLLAPSAVTCVGGAVALNLSGQPAGTYTVTVHAVDAGVTSPGALTLTYALTVPDATLAARSNPADQTGVADDVAGTGRSPSWTVADADGGATFLCSVTRPDGSLLAPSAVTCVGGTVALDLSSQPAGTYTVAVTAVDAGVTSPGTLTLTYALTVPNPTLAAGSNPANQTGVADDVAGTGRAPSWTVTDADAGATYLCSVTRPDGSLLAPSAVTCVGGAVALDLSGQPAGTYTVTVTAVDAGVDSPGTLMLTYALTVPNPTVTGAANQRGSATSVTWTVNDADALATISCVVTGPHGALPAGEVQCALGPNGIALSLGTEVAGHYSVVITATDNGVDAPGTLTLGYDLYPPTPTLVSGSAGQKGTGRSPQWGVSDTDPFATYACAVTMPDGRALPPSHITCAGGTVQLDLTGEPAGTYTVVVTAMDNGVSSADLDPADVLTLTYTLYPPTPTMLSGSPDQSGVADTNNAGRTPVWSVQVADPAAALICTVSGPALTTTVRCTTGSNGVSLNLAGLPAGTYTITVTALDNGVKSSDLAIGDVLTLTYRLIPATPILATGTANQVGIAGANNSGRAVSWSVSDGDSGATLSCTVTGPSGSTLAGTSSCVTGNGGVRLDLTNQPAGTYTVTITAVDAGVSSAGSLVLTYTMSPAAPTANSATSQTGAGRNPTWTVSDGDAGVSSYQCSVTGPAGSAPTVDCATFGSVRVTLPNQPGTYTVTVIAIDNGVASTPLTLTYLLVPPTPTLVSAPPSPLNSRTPTWTVTDGMPGVTYACTVGGPTAVGVSCANGTVTLNLSNAADGVYTVSVLAVDSLGHTSDVTAPLLFSYQLDTTAPVAPTVTVTPSPSQGRTATYVISNVEPAGTVSCSFAAPTGSTVTVPAACGAGATLNLTGQPDGNYVLTVTVTDVAGNTSVATVATYILDTTPPLAPIASITSPGNDVTPTPTLIVEPGAQLTCAIQKYFLPVATVACGTDGTVDLTGYGDGEFEISLWATDAAGNVGPASQPYVYLLDTVPPATPVLTSPASPSPVENPVWRWTSDPQTTGTCTVTSVNGTVVTGPVGCTDIFTGDFTALPDGSYTLSVVVTDTAGNHSRAATSVFLLDRTAPVPPTVVPPASPGNTTSPRWLITAPRGATLTCTLTRGHVTILGPGACPTGGVVSLLGMPDGTYTMRVTATDSAGNVSAASITTYVLDTVAPSAPTLSYGSPSSGSSRTPFWGFALPAGTTGRCELLTGGTVIAVRTDCHGAVSFTLNGDGQYVVRIFALDAAGNASPPLVVGYQLYGSGGSAGAGLVGRGGSGGAHGPRTPKGPVPSTVQRLIDHLGAVAGQAGKTVRKAAGGVASALPNFPVIHDPLTNNVSHAVQNVINAVSKAGGGTGFPLLLLVIVALFLMAQSRVDRRDPKLALASVAADDNLQFGPPPSRGDA